MQVKDAGPIQAVKLDECGLARLFGELEARIMDAVWSLEAATVHDLCAHLGSDCNYKTIMTVANRLVRKGALRRHRQGRAYVYEPVVCRDALLEGVACQIIVGLVDDFGTPVMAGLAQALHHVAPAELQKLQRLIGERLAVDAQVCQEQGVG
jgi:predicted transcriptional regulator